MDLSWNVSGAVLVVCFSVLIIEVYFRWAHARIQLDRQLEKACKLPMAYTPAHFYSLSLF